MPVVFQPRRPEDFDDLYRRGMPPWDTGRPQPAFVGLEATGIDVAAAAVERAREKASDRQPGVLGPRRVTQEEIRATFADGWRVDSIEPALEEREHR
jgi:hypothetical protein